MSPFMCLLLFFAALVMQLVVVVGADRNHVDGPLGVGASNTVPNLFSNNKKVTSGQAAGSLFDNCTAYSITTCPAEHCIAATAVNKCLQPCGMESCSLSTETDHCTFINAVCSPNCTLFKAGPSCDNSASGSTASGVYANDDHFCITRNGQCLVNCAKLFGVHCTYGCYYTGQFCGFRGDPDPNKSKLVKAVRWTAVALAGVLLLLFVYCRRRLQKQMDPNTFYRESGTTLVENAPYVKLPVDLDHNPPQTKEYSNLSCVRRDCSSISPQDA